jgi:hypothetical protein
MKYIDPQRICERKKVSSTLVQNILKHCALLNPDYTSVTCEATNQESDMIIDEITTYDDIYNKVSLDKKTSFYIYKDKSKKQKYMFCFKPSEEMARFKSVKQKLADISTGHVIQQLTNEDYKRFFKTFYVSTNIVIEEYAKMHNLNVPSDLCFYYKGGNLYKILLNELIPLFSTHNFASLLKRSDADFGVFINPDIPNYKKVYDDVSVLIMYMMYSFKKHMQQDDFGLSNINHKVLLKDLTAELISSKIPYSKADLVTNHTRKDFSFSPITIQDEPFVMYKELPMLISGAPKVDVSRFYLSRNTAIRFKRKDNTYNSFDLLRIKYILKLKVDQTLLSIPSEVIDVGIAKPEDVTIKSLKKSAQKCLKQYRYQDNQDDFVFWGPTLSYMIKDVDTILFHQNDFPWHDKKTQKRIQRYFLCLLLQTIVSSSIDDPILKLNIIKQEFKKLIKFLTCFNDNSQCEIYGEENVSGLFYAKYKKLSAKINAIKNTKQRAQELIDFKSFNTEIILILKSIVKNILYLIANTSQGQLEHIQKKVTILNTTWHLGGNTKVHKHIE